MKHDFACILAVLLIAGLGCQQPIQRVEVEYSSRFRNDERNEAAYELTPDTPLNKVRANTVVVSGLITGNTIRLNSGKVISRSAGKAEVPLAIEFGSQPLAIVPDTDEIARVLLEHTDRRVTIEGRLMGWTVEGRGNLGQQQQGYTGPIPDHRVYFIFAKSCRLLDDTEHRKP